MESEIPIKRYLSSTLLINECTPDIAELQKYELHPVFTYGTLMRGHYNHSYLKEAQLICKGETKSAFNLFNYIQGGFPVLTLTGQFKELLGDNPSKYQGHVEGELYFVDTKTIRSLDHLEGNGSMYQRLWLPITFCETPSSPALVDHDGMYAHVYVGLQRRWIYHRKQLSPFVPFQNVERNHKSLRFSKHSKFERKSKCDVPSVIEVSPN